LFTLADDNDSAAYYRRMANNGLDRGVLLWRARMVLTAPAPVDAAERRRACRLLLAAANELLNVGPFDEGLAFANAAHGLSDRRADQARGQYLMGGHLSSLGELNETRRAFTASGRLYSDLGDRSGEADAREALAGIDGLQGDYERARNEFSAVLALRRELGDRSGEADCEAALEELEAREEPSTGQSSNAS
jgi:tetratricopeptide (TPR) repeat protein